MEKLDLLILRSLSKGLTVGEIPDHLKTEEGLKISKSSIEKRLTRIRKIYGAKTMFQLAVLLKENELI